MKLKKTSVPTLKLHPNQRAATSSERDVRYKRRKALQLEAAQHEDLSDKEYEDITDMDSDPSRIKELESKVEKQADQIDKLKKKLRKAQYQVSELKKRRPKCRTSKCRRLTIAKEVLLEKSSWSNQQVDYLLKQKTRAKWAPEDLVLGLTLRAISRRTYEFLRKKKLLPLPSLTTLRTHIANFKCLPGLQYEILQVISHQREVIGDGSESPIPVALSFDEMSLQKDIQFHQAEQKVFGPHEQAQTAMVRGILKNFKQPIYYAFDETMTRKILFDIMDRVEEIGLHVEVVTHDMGGKNMSLWRELGIAPGNVSFTYRGRKVNVMADVPHLLKLLRNHLLDKGFILKSGAVIRKSDLTAIIEKDSGELRMTHKLKPIHFECSGSQRQRVNLAAQLLSRSTASALRLVAPEKVEQADFIQLGNDLFDVMNSRSAEGHKQYDYALGWESRYKSFEEQKQILLKGKEEIGGMRAIDTKKLLNTGKMEPVKALLPFQKGWLVSIDSVLELLCKMQEKYKSKFLMTSRVNQDCLENFFSRIRYIGGGHAHPGPVEFINRLRLIVLGQSTEYIVHGTAVTADEDQESRDTDIILSQEFVRDIQPNTDSTEELQIGCLETTVMNDEADIDCGAEAMKYLAGYVAFKFKAQYPDMSESGSLDVPVHCPWIETYSYGGLVKPSESWLSQYGKFEGEFQNMFGFHISRESGIIQKLEQHLMDKFPLVPPDVVKFYAKMRIHIRIKYLRLQFKTASEEKRNAKKVKHFTS